MNEFKKFIKNENDNWEEYKDLINEDTKFMMFDGENAKELSVSETIHQLRLDNKYLELQIINLQSKIDKANEILEKILVVSDWEHKGRFRPVKGTTAQDVYKTIVKLNELLETPRRINYELLKEDK